MATEKGKLFHARWLLLTMLPCTACVAQDAAMADKEQYWLSDGGLYRITYSSTLEPIEINRIHEWILHVATSAGEAVEVADITIDGGMPAHDHGMPTRPRVTEYLGDGNYKVQGMRFHMHGEWQISISISLDGKHDNVDIVLQL